MKSALAVLPLAAALLVGPSTPEPAPEWGSPVSWGFNAHGQLGDGTHHYPATPVRACAVGEVAPCGRFLTGATAPRH